MLSQAWMTSRRALSRGGTWTVLVWSALFILLFVGGLLAAGARTLLTAMLHPQIIGGTPTLATSTMGHNLIGIFILYLVAIGIGPFYLAGVYGLLGLAVQGQTVSWRKFWAMGRRCYGRFTFTS